MAQPDQDTLNSLLGRMVGDLGAIGTGALVVLGDRLGLFKAMRAGGRMTAAELAERTGTHARYIREWLSGQAAAGYVEYDAGSDRFYLSPEQELVFADEDSPAFMAGAFEVMASLWIDEPKVSEAFRSGKGLGWHDHSACLFRGTERFFRPGYNANLIGSWLPALDGVVEKLERGVAVADVGCGHGASTVLMARAFPRSTFVGFDYHAASIERARKAAADAGVAGNARFEVAPAKAYPGTYDLVTFFDCLHDMGDPAGASAHVRRSLTPDGTWMIVEPFAHDHLSGNLNPVGRVYYAASTMVCTPASLAQEVGLGLGAQAGEAKLRQVVTAGGFSRFRRAAETPFNMVLKPVHNPVGEIAMDTISLDAVRHAIETRDAPALRGFYADDAVLLIIDRMNPPTSPREIKGRAAVAEYFDDVCGRAMTHTVANGIESADRMAFTQACRYPDGKGVFCAATLELAAGKIVRQVMVQAWDE